ncbi:MAG: DUF1232 domain-containing protein [Bacteroidia bacterium]|nr:DUF1232 domain-containing protein [Bacteroidia bacterium]
MIMDYKKYIPNFSEIKFWNTIKDRANRLGQKTIYSTLLLYYAFRRKDTPVWAKNIVLGVLGYLITPIDFIPDLTPIIGYTDDIGVLSFGLVAIACFVNDEVKSKSRTQMSKWFNKLDEETIAEVNKQL